eukprot:CAMPEP_0198140094 /NCGR_PEP_ID=MMETSP1443-20131203/3301_1 /TAXON_ID=186043 /ORGANISM="Entomoneis sp., Strain CCMP2396" /LENGTH=242 /DNA_ID=CAMNT_0043802417 /DNA_START=223 /DNA_END=948 /DNA_ORIENTATION=-
MNSVGDTDNATIDIYKQETAIEEDYDDMKEKRAEFALPMLSWFSTFRTWSTRRQRYLSTKPETDEEAGLVSEQMRPLSEESSFELTLFNSSSFGSSEDEETYEDEKKAPTKGPNRLRASHSMKPLELEEYAKARSMTKTQEKWNALTMIPPSVYCLFYMLSGAWVNADLVTQAREEYYANPASFENVQSTGTGLAGVLTEWLGNPETGCLSTSYMPAIPPLGVLAVVIGTCLHMPFSFIYHW